MSELTREEFLPHMDALHTSIGDVQTSVDRIDGRLRQAEQKLAVLDDRAMPARTAALWGSGTSGFVVALIESVKWMLGK